jgi:hypothetical protein
MEMMPDSSRTAAIEPNARTSLTLIEGLFSWLRLNNLNAISMHV